MRRGELVAGILLAVLLAAAWFAVQLAAAGCVAAFVAVQG